eukprot:CAMPEP_0202113456 /NCGR_PEP_ID=MMETSP0965-20130614/33935_1 /ASSEMBLY_ACC=CAM_ASM_000507 /TAXON_ID=4773 /ORGANISM="Schizochytrium aggregatum, Strain ATCC28209" /LENGTH=91 /DNA_ID=CAMNT_0048683079 /DNA_START=200 /DNA_END=472 /DNA_ORIENTATION=-
MLSSRSPAGKLTLEALQLCRGHATQHGRGRRLPTCLVLLLVRGFKLKQKAARPIEGSELVLCHSPLRNDDRLPCALPATLRRIERAKQQRP